MIGISLKATQRMAQIATDESKESSRWLRQTHSR
jgi:hypothetical protein